MGIIWYIGPTHAAHCALLFNLCIHLFLYVMYNLLCLVKQVI